MEQIRIDYLPDSRQVKISITGSISGFKSRAIRLFYNETEEASQPEPSVILAPWWVFLLKKERLAEWIQHYRLGNSLDLGEEAQEQLTKAKENLDKYHLAKSAEAIPNENLVKELDESDFDRILYPYQLENVRTLSSLPSGATFSVPGAGKTTEALAFFAIRRLEATKLLIVCPKNAFAVWEEEIENCFKSDIPPVIVRLRGLENTRQLLNAEPEVMLTTYSQFQITGVRDIIADFMVRHDTIMFLDESHHMKKGLEGVRGKSILGISHLPSAKMIMTGTPMPNSPSDLIAQFNFLYPEVDVDEYNIIEHIQPTFVRTTKNDLNLPEKREILIPIPMSPSQERLYNVIRNESRLRLEGLPAGSQMSIRELRKCYIKLLQLASNPGLLTADISSAHPTLLAQMLDEGDCSKLEYACTRARELANEGKKTIIWSSFVKNVELISERLQDIGAVYIHGGVDAGSEEEEQTREWKIKKFKNDPNCKVLVANPAAAGEGISLHKVCLNAIYIDRTFNAAHYLQSVDRIHRLGLEPDEHPLVEILVSVNSIDEAVNTSLDLKIWSMFEALNDDSLRTNPIEYDAELSMEDGISEEDFQGIADHMV